MQASAPLPQNYNQEMIPQPLQMHLSQQQQMQYSNEPLLLYGQSSAPYNEPEFEEHSYTHTYYDQPNYSQNMNIESSYLNVQNSTSGRLPM